MPFYISNESVVCNPDQKLIVRNRFSEGQFNHFCRAREKGTE